MNKNSNSLRKKEQRAKRSAKAQRPVKPETFDFLGFSALQKCTDMEVVMT